MHDCVDATDLPARVAVLGTRHRACVVEGPFLACVIS